MNILRKLALWTLVEALPNGCALSHFCTEPEHEPVAWQILDARTKAIVSGATIYECLEAWEKHQESEAFWRKQLGEAQP